MSDDKYNPFYRELKDALVQNRGKVSKADAEDRVVVLERRLETEKLTVAQADDIRKQIKQLKEQRRA